MKLNRFLLMGIFLLAVMLVGCVSAADNATADSIKLDGDNIGLDSDEFSSVDEMGIGDDSVEDSNAISSSIETSDSMKLKNANDDFVISENESEETKITPSLTVTPSAQTYKYGADVTLTVGLKDDEDVGISGEVTVIVDNTDYLVNVSNGRGSLTISGLENGTYDVLAIFNATEKYESVINSDAQFIVNKSRRVTADVVVENATYGNPAVLKITNLCDVDGKKLSAFGGFQIVGPSTPYGSFSVSRGKATVNLKDLPAGNYSIYIVFGNNIGGNYEFDNYIVNFTIFEAPVILSANADEYDYGSSGCLNVKVTDTKNKAISGKINVTIDNETYAFDVAVTNGEVNVTLDGLSAGEHSAEITFKADNYEFTNVTTGFFVVPKIITNLKADNLVMCYKNGSSWTVTLTDSNNNVISGVVVKIAVAGKVYCRITDVNGVASLPINLGPGVYDISASYEGNDDYANAFINRTVTVTKAIAILSAENIVMTYRDDSALLVSLTDSNGSPIAGVSVNMGIGKEYGIKTNASGIAKLPINLSPGNYTVTISFNSSKYEAESITLLVTVNKANPILTGSDLVAEYKGGSKYNVTLTDQDGNAMSNCVVKITVLGKTYNRKTDANGVASLPINLAVGNYTISAKFDGNSKLAPVEITSTVVVVKPEITIVANDINMTYKDGTSYDVQLIDGNGNPRAIAGEIVKITVMGKTYSCKTNAEGIASLPINLACGTYSIVAEYDGKEICNNITVNK